MIKDLILNWWSRDHDIVDDYHCDFGAMCRVLRPGDVILVDGNSYFAHTIKMITQSTWSHTALYTGLQEGEPYIIEGMIGQGIIEAPLLKYKGQHMRICRPSKLSVEDCKRVCTLARQQVGYEYDLRHIFDLGRFLLPIGILPRTWKSKLFDEAAHTIPKQICTSLIGDSFLGVEYTVSPRLKDNSKLLTPKDFDLSPNFEIVKYTRSS